MCSEMVSFTYQAYLVCPGSRSSCKDKEKESPMRLDAFHTSPMAMEDFMNSPNSGFTFMGRVDGYGTTILGSLEKKANEDEVEKKNKKKQIIERTKNV